MSAKRYDLQYLRAIAILAVLLFHLNQNSFPNGFLGVDVFFVLSGYLMTSSLNFDKKLSLNLIINFYGRRIKRIFPVYYLTILTTLLICGYFLSSFDYSNLKTDTIWSICFLTNFKSIFTKQNYFNFVSEFKFLLHTWSLAVEFQFYFIAPFLFYFIFCCQNQLLMIIAGGFVSLIFQLETSFENFQAISFEFLGSRLWQFLTGAFVFYVENTKFKKEFVLFEGETIQFSKTAVFNKIFLLFLLFCCLLFPRFPKTMFYKNSLRIIVTFITGCFMFVKVDEKLPILTKILVYVGDISYSVYLIHWPIIVLAKYLYCFDNYSQAFWMGLIFGISVLEFELFEKQILKAAKEKVFLICIALFLTVVVILMNEQSFGLQIRQKHPLALAHQKLLDTCRTVDNDLNCNYDPKIMFIVNKTKQDLPNYTSYCSYKGIGKSTVLVAGNSFASYHFKAIKAALNGKYSVLYLMTRPTCLTFKALNIDFPLWHRCSVTDDDLMKTLQVLKPNMLIIIQKYSKNPITSLPLTAPKDYVTELMAKDLSIYSNFVEKIFLIEPNPSRSKKNYFLSNFESEFLNNKSVLENFNYQNTANEELGPGWTRILNASKSCSICETIDTRFVFCPNKKCPFFDKNTKMSLYCDAYHLSPFGANKLIPIFKTKFLKIN